MTEGTKQIIIDMCISLVCEYIENKIKTTYPLT